MIMTTAVHAGLLDPEGLLKGFGSLAFVVALAIVFIECGVIFGAILPGDSLLFIVGILLASNFIPVPEAVAYLLLMAAAISGNVVGYWSGAKIGPALFKRSDSRIFRQEFVNQTETFFARHGNRAIVLARFVPIVRSVITSVAGIARMDYRAFVTYSAIGAVVWVGVMVTAGFFLGNVTFIKNNIDLVTLAIVGLSVLPVLWEMYRHRKNK
ncbi:unannotated protein [freshwater metagenome]|uniref:Unannotated protein n=1 Tax=freshwater metagenome TaxID=449393 RepID=A0A6J5YWX0_9ZZZZ